MKEFIHQALGLGSEWHVGEVSINHEQKRVEIELTVDPAALGDHIKVDASQTIRYLPIFEYQTFLVAPVLWNVSQGKRGQRLRYSWESNVPKEIHDPRIL